MALGFNVSSGADYQLICKYDSRSGRMTRRDRNAQTGGWDNPDITDSFRAVFDFASANFEIGWLNFNTGSAPDFAMVPHGEPMPPQPTPGHKQGARVLIMLSNEFGGTVRELASNAKAFLRGISDLHDAYLAQLAGNEGKLPVVILDGSTIVQSGSGATKAANHSPNFKIVGFVDRPAQLVAKAKPASVSRVQSTAAPVTGSTRVSAPAESSNGFGFG